MSNQCSSGTQFSERVPECLVQSSSEEIQCVLFGFVLLLTLLLLVIAFSKWKWQKSATAERKNSIFSQNMFCFFYILMFGNPSAPTSHNNLLYFLLLFGKKRSPLLKHFCVHQKWDNTFFFTFRCVNKPKRNFLAPERILDFLVAWLSRTENVWNCEGPKAENLCLLACFWLVHKIRVWLYLNEYPA